MTTARDVTERDTESAAEIVSQFHFSNPLVMLDCVKDSEQWAQVIAAALSERERETVERCCKAVCVLCKAGIPLHDEKMHEAPTADVDYFAYKCSASSIRADAARRETP